MHWSKKLKTQPFDIQTRRGMDRSAKYFIGSIVGSVLTMGIAVYVFGAPWWGALAAISGASLFGVGVGAVLVFLDGV